MKKFTLITGVCLAALALGGPRTASAAPKKEASPSPSASPDASTAEASPAEKTPRAVRFRGSVASVDSTAKTFTIAGNKNSRVFKVTDKTTVTKDGATATFADITANEMVSGSYWKQDDGSMEAKMVTIGGSRAAKGKSGKKAKKSDATDASMTASPSPSASP